MRGLNMLRLAGIAGIIGLQALLLCSCGGTPEAEGPVSDLARHGGVLRFVQEGPRSLDPRAADSVYESLPVNQLFDTLVTLDPSMNLKPALAETWTVSKDELTFIFKLRDGVLFHNGQTLTSDDVAFTLLRHMQPGGGQHSGSGLQGRSQDRSRRRPVVR